MLTDELLDQLGFYVRVNFIEPAPKRPKRPKPVKGIAWVSSSVCYSIRESYSRSREPFPKAKLADRLKLLKLTFPQYLLNFIAERGLDEVDVYKRANLDRRIFSKLRNQKGYMPRKRTIIAIAFAMELTLDEAQKLLERGGYYLSEYSKEDVIIAFCFDNKIYDLFTVNEALDHYGFKPIS